MTRNKLLRIAASGLVLAGATLGTASLGGIAAASADGPAKKADSFARKATKALSKQKLDKALVYAERAVEGNPRHAGHRAVLAQVYMAQGRFLSAERSWQDVIDLGGTSARSVLGVALAQIAQGKVASAKAALEANRELIPAADFGLAMALAGDTGRAVDVLVDAIRRDDATARTRQNLALAYALDGRWREARIMAVQDMPQTMVDARVAEWAQMARPGAYQLRIASLLKVNPREDAGQPVRLALAPAAPAYADAAPSPVLPPMEPTAQGELPAVGPAVDLPAGFVAAEPDRTVAPQGPSYAGAPVISAPAAPFKADPAPKLTVTPGTRTAMAEPTAPVLRQSDGRASDAYVTGSHVVQIGAFSSPTQASAAWTKLARKHGVLGSFRSVQTQVVVGGKSFTRLAAIGLGNKATADALCLRIKQGGDACIVKSVATRGEVRVAAASPAGKMRVRVKYAKAKSLARAKAARRLAKGTPVRRTAAAPVKLAAAAPQPTKPFLKETAKAPAAKPTKLAQR